jgi:catechol-2,3-dioxygenase
MKMVNKMAKNEENAMIDGMQIQELGHVVLFVSQLKRSADFYRDTLGFRELDRTANTAVFSSGRTHHELLLIEIGGSPKQPTSPQPGLYHIGFKIGDSPDEAKRVYKELQEKGVPITGTGDHGVTHSIYILDPDGNELELYADVSDAWKTNPQILMQPTRSLDLDEAI